LLFLAVNLVSLTNLPSMLTLILVRLLLS